METQELHLEVSPRDVRGKNASRRLRAQGLVPAVVYGGSKEPVAIQVERRKIEELLRKAHTEHPIFFLDLVGTGKSRHAMIQERQLDVVNGQTVHVDFLRVAMDRKIKVEVAIELVGTPYGVKTEGGVLDFVTREVEIECLPGDMPAHLTADVSKLHVGQHLEAGQLELPKGVEMLTDVDRVIVSIAQVRTPVLDGEEQAESGLLEVQREEPEVIGRGGDDDAEA